jgi:hypothetical protein
MSNDCRCGECKEFDECMARREAALPPVRVQAVVGGIPSATDDWARVELFRWQYGTLPMPDDMRPLDVANGMIQMAKALELPLKRDRDVPMPGNVAAVLRYAAKLLSANVIWTSNRKTREPNPTGSPLPFRERLYTATPRRAMRPPSRLPQGPIRQRCLT